VSTIPGAPFLFSLQLCRAPFQHFSDDHHQSISNQSSNSKASSSNPSMVDATELATAHSITLRLAFPFLAHLALFYMFGIGLAGFTSGGFAVSVCLARLSDASLVPTMTRATLYALGAGNSDASTIPPQS
jgi:hypothetical protein